MELAEKLWAHEQIRARLHLYCKGIDRRDWALVRSCFADDHHHNHGAFVGSPDDFVKGATQILAAIPATHHTVGNMHIDLAPDGLSAETEANFVAYHRIEAGHHEGTPIPTGGKAMDWTVAGRYCDRMEVRDGVWLIVRRNAFHDWERADEATL